MKQTVTAQEFSELTDVLQAEYTLNEASGVYELKIEGTGLNTALDAERKNAKSWRQQANSLKKKIDSLEALGKTPEELAELISQSEEAEQRAMEAKGQWDALKQQMENNHSTAIKKSQEQVNSIRKQLMDEKISKQAAIVCAEVGIPTEPILDRLARVASMNEKYEVLLKEGDQVLYSRDPEHTGQTMSIKEYISTYLPENDAYNRFYPAEKTKTGSGTTSLAAKRTAGKGTRIVSTKDLLGGGIDPSDIVAGKIEVAVNDSDT